ncbi:sialin-like isoform X2 [Babylonia areolata]
MVNSPATPIPTPPATTTSITTALTSAAPGPLRSSSATTGSSSNSSEGEDLGGLHGSSTGEGGGFDWDETTVGLILGAFFYGYFWPQMCFGQLAQGALGGRLVMGLSLMGSSAVNLLMPWAAHTGVGVFVGLRAVQGFFEAGSFPGMHTMLGAWSPVAERSRLANFTYLGVEIGTVVGMLTSGFLSQSSFLSGWPSIFYIHGTVGCVLAVAWVIVVRNSPAQHPRITCSEKEVIAYVETNPQKARTPWRHILTSHAVWAVAYTHFMTAWGFGGTMALLPTYLSSALHFDIEQNGVLSSIPFIAQLCVEVVGGIGLDLVKKYNVTRSSRKIFNTVGAVLTAAFFIATGYVPEDSPMLAVAFVTLAVGSSALCVCCVRVGHLDLAPHMGGTLYALTNTLANTSGFLAPLIAGILTQDEQTQEQWRYFFYINAGLFLGGALVFLACGKEEEQAWSKATSFIFQHATPPSHSQDLEKEEGGEEGGGEEGVGRAVHYEKV